MLTNLTLLSILTSSDRRTRISDEITADKPLKKQNSLLWTTWTPQVDLTFFMIEIVTCRHIPGPSAFLVNAEKLGVAWGWGYMFCMCAKLHVPKKPGQLLPSLVSTHWLLLQLHRDMDMHHQHTTCLQLIKDMVHWLRACKQDRKYVPYNESTGVLLNSQHNIPVLWAWNSVVPYSRIIRHLTLISAYRSAVINTRC